MVFVGEEFQFAGSGCSGFVVVGGSFGGREVGRGFCPADDTVAEETGLEVGDDGHLAAAASAHVVDAGDVLEGLLVHVVDAGVVVVSTADDEIVVFVGGLGGFAELF